MSGSLNNELNKQVFTSAYTSIEVKKYECKLGGGVSITKRRDRPLNPDQPLNTSSLNTDYAVLVKTN